MAYFLSTESRTTAPSFGYCALQDCYFFGYKLHALCGISGVTYSYDMSKAESKGSGTYFSSLLQGYPIFRKDYTY